jgi:hypothetical protein
MNSQRKKIINLVISLCSLAACLVILTQLWQIHDSSKFIIISALVIAVGAAFGVFFLGYRRLPPEGFSFVGLAIAFFVVGGLYVARGVVDTLRGKPEFVFGGVAMNTRDFIFAGVGTAFGGLSILCLSLALGCSRQQPLGQPLEISQDKKMAKTVQQMTEAERYAYLLNELRATRKAWTLVDAHGSFAPLAFSKRA